MMIPWLGSGNSIRLILILFTSINFSAGFGFAGGPVHGVKAAGMGTAFVGIADDPSTILYNPAGLGNLTGSQIYVGLSVLSPSTSFTTLDGEAEDTKQSYYFPPNAYFTWNPGSSDLVMGLGLFAPFGIGGRKWSGAGLTRFVSTESLTATFAINPSLAWRVTPKVFIGGGAYYLYARNEAENRVDQSMLSSTEGVFELEADGGNWGYDFGILYRPHELIQLGAAYRSSVDIDLKGEASLSQIAPALQPIFGGPSFNTEVKSELKLPPILSLGIAIFPNEKLTIGFDVDWVGWSRYDRTVIDFKDEVPSFGLSDIAYDNNWKDSWIFKGGMEYLAGDRLALRAGYAFVESPVPDSTLSPAAPDADQHNISFGLGYRIGSYWFDTFYMLALYEDRTVNNSILSGNYENSAHYVGIGVGYRF